jgi:hypothetical protein
MSNDIQDRITRQSVSSGLSQLTQGPLITDGWNSSKWTGHYVGWFKTLQMVKFLSKMFEKYFQINNFIDRKGYRSHFLHQIVATP